MCWGFRMLILIRLRLPRAIMMGGLVSGIGMPCVGVPGVVVTGAAIGELVIVYQAVTCHVLRCQILWSCVRVLDFMTLSVRIPKMDDRVFILKNRKQ